MQKVSVSLRDRDLYELAARQRLGEADSRSDALRQVLDEYYDVRTECEALRTECEELRTDCERLRNEKQTIVETMQDRAETQELVKYVEAREDAGVVTRAKWWLFGRDE